MITFFIYCDDLAIATLNMIQTWKELLPLFNMIFKVSLLEINQGKTQFCTTAIVDAQEILDQLVIFDDQVMFDNVKPYLKYLGIFIGHNYDIVCQKSFEIPMLKYRKTIFCCPILIVVL